MAYGNMGPNIKRRLETRRIALSMSSPPPPTHLKVSSRPWLFSFPSLNILMIPFVPRPLLRLLTFESVRKTCNAKVFISAVLFLFFFRDKFLSCARYNVNFLFVLVIIMVETRGNEIEKENKRIHKMVKLNWCPLSWERPFSSCLRTSQ